MVGYKRKNVKTRKDHDCAFCKSKILSGSTVTCESGIFDGEPFRRYACEECEPHLDGFFYFMKDESFCTLPGDFLEWCWVEGIEHSKVKEFYGC